MKPDTPSAPRRRMRWWIPASILALSGGTIGWIYFGETVFFKPQASAAVTSLTLLLLALWYIFFTGLPFLRRSLLLGALLALVVGIVLIVRNLTRIEGSYTGAGFPRLVWKWSPKTDARLARTTTTRADSGLVASAAVALPAFPEFLGPGRSNTLQGVHLARDWKTQPPQEIWRRPVGLGWSSFAIADGRAITQEQRGDDELVVAYGLLNGQVLWAHTNHARFSETLGGDGPRATPTIVSNRVFVLGATGLLDCLDAATGQRVWSRDVLRETKTDNLTWGKSASPLVFDDLVVVSGGDSGPLLLAFHKGTGTPAWTGGNGASSYASPVLATVTGHRQILSVNAHSVTGHGPANGKVLWKFDWPGNFPKCSQPLPIVPDKVFISASYGLGCALLQLKPAADGQFSVNEIWSNKNMKSKFSSLALRGGFIYGLDEGILACIDLATGARRWKGGRYGHGQLLLADDLLLVQTEPGGLMLVEANPREHRELGRWPALNAKTWNTPALSGNYLLVRNDREAICFRLSTNDGARTQAIK